jgi:hypothetical protein
MLLHRAMNRRLFTIINAAIALVTVGAVVVDLTRSHGQRAHSTRGQSGAVANQTRDSAQQARADIEHIEDIADVRVDNLGAVAASELAQVMERAKPGELGALAAKFNDLPIDAHTLGGLGVFFQAWTQLEPRAALIGALGLKDVTMRKLAARVVAGAVSPASASELANYLVAHPDKDLMVECKNEFIDTLIGSWAYLDPEAASNFTDKVGSTDGGLHYNARTNIAYAWGTLDPDAALDWLNNQSREQLGDSESLYDEIIKGWCDKNVGAACAYVEQHLDNAAAQGAADTVAAAMFSHDIESATTWTSRLPPGPARNNAEASIARRWAQKDPSAAASWVATLTPDEQANVVGTIAGSWADKNWAETSTWLGTLTGAARDEALIACTHRDGATPSDSLSLALAISNGETRSNTIQNLVSEWASSDRGASETWIKNNSLPSDQQAQLLSMIAEGAEVERVIITH